LRSLKFPNMFNKNSTNVWKEEEHKQATMQNCLTLLHTTRGELIGDPYFGLLLKHYLFEQNTIALADIIIDIIYTQLAIFIPQLKINRNNIEILQDQEMGRLICSFIALDKIDYTINTYQLVLFKLENNV